MEKTKICIPAMLKPYSASSFCLPNKNRVGVAHGDGTNLEVVYRTATMPEQVAIDDAHVASSSTSTTTSVQALLSAHTSGSGVNRDGQLLEQLTSGHVELWEGSAIMRLASGAYF